MRPSRVTAPAVVVLAIDALEGRGLVYRHGAGAILVFLVWVLDGRAESREAVRLARSDGGLGLRSWEIVALIFAVRREDRRLGHGQGRSWK